MTQTYIQKVICTLKLALNVGFKKFSHTIQIRFRFGMANSINMHSRLEYNNIVSFFNGHN